MKDELAAGAGCIDPFRERLKTYVIPFPVADMTVRISRKEIRRRRFSSQRTM
jgi:hypothetical protein